jgi:hypothetical protein
MQFEEVEIDIFNDGQLNEHYLTKVNRKGQVRLPVSVNKWSFNLMQCLGPCHRT